MDEKYTDLYRKLGIEIKAPQENYSPDSFARNLMKDIPKKPSISYTANTNYYAEKNDTGSAH